MKKHTKIILVALWVAVLAGTGVWYALFAGREAVYYERENRSLAALPEISLRTFWEGGLSDGLETYFLDRFWGRGAALSLSERVKDMGSIATYEDSLAIMGGSEDALSGDAPDDGALQDMVDSLLDGSGNGPEPTPSPAVTPTPEGGDEPAVTPEPTPGITPKPEADIDDYPEWPAVGASYGEGGSRVWLSWPRTNVLAVASVLNRVAALLPEGGRLVYTMVPQSYIANSYLTLEDKGAFYSEAEEIVHAFSADNVTAVSTPAVLDAALKNGEYVYFRSDMHWTPEGTYLVYREMLAAAGVTPTEWEDFTVSVEEPFLGTYYRDNPSGYMAANPDSLTLVTPSHDYEWRRVTAPDEYELIPLLDFGAASNDRYTVYLGGPDGPWTYLTCDNGARDSCLVITDSFGLAFVPMVGSSYAETHYLDPRYYSYDKVGYTVAEMIEKHGIKDVYVVVGDLHSYSSDFILSQLSSQIGD